jgi:hypothetical protein
MATTQTPNPMCAMVMPTMARGNVSRRRRRSMGSNSDDRMIQMPSTTPNGVSHFPGP